MVPRILQLLGSDKSPPPIRAEISGDTAVLYFYGPIGWYGNDAESLVRLLATVKLPKICMRINSPGGDVMEARSMHTALSMHPAEVTAVVDGLAASAASFLMLAADKVEIAPGAFVMIHDPWTIAVDDADGLRKTADLLDKVKGVIAADYAQKTGKSPAEIAAAMAEETWFTGPEAVAWGLCDGLTTDPEEPGETVDPAMNAEVEPAVNDLARLFNLSAYVKVPKALTETPVPPQSDPAGAIAALQAHNLRRLELFDRIRA